jgi:hypothetical protein
VKALTVEMTDGAIATTFSTTFLTAVPADTLKAVFAAMKAQVGACKEHRAEQLKSETGEQVRLLCERGAVRATIVVNPATPHVIEGLLLQPAP